MAAGGGGAGIGSGVGSVSGSAGSGTSQRRPWCHNAAAPSAPATIAADSKIGGRRRDLRGCGVAAAGPDTSASGTSSGAEASTFATIGSGATMSDAGGNGATGCGDTVGVGVGATGGVRAVFISSKVREEAPTSVVA
jgi:hypothetical protein